MAIKLQTIVGQHIAHLRKQKKLSQQEFSYEANMERSYLTKIESGEKNISMATLQKILDGLGTSAKDFFNDKSFGK